MASQTSSDLPRNGAAKRPQTTFAIKDGMKDQTSMSGVSPGANGSGPDASSPNPLDPEPRDKLLKKQGGSLAAAWGMTDGDGDGVDNAIGGRVLDEAVLGAKLPG
jgi:hypothetical protein